MSLLLASSLCEDEYAAGSLLSLSSVAAVGLLWPLKAQYFF